MKSQNDENMPKIDIIPDTQTQQENKKHKSYEDTEGYIFSIDKHHYHSHKKKMKKGKKIVVISASVVLALILLTVGTVTTLNILGKNALLDNSQQKIVSPNIDDVTVDETLRTITYKGVTYTQNKNITTILAMGVDKTQLDTDNGNYGTAGQADVIMAIAANIETGTTKVINIPRDTMTNVDVYDVAGNFTETKKMQVCLAYAYGDGKQKSCENMVKSVSEILYGTKINSYMALDLESIPVINDSVNGVQVVSLETFGDFTKGQSVTLIGNDATSYIRYRNTKDINSNLLRNQRQIQYIQALSQKIISQTKKDISTPLNLFNSISPYMVTNIDAPKVTFLATNSLTKGFTELNISSIPGEMKNAEPYSEFVPNEEDFYQIYLDTFYTVVK